MTMGCLGYKDFHYMYKDKTAILYLYWWFLYWLNLTVTSQKGLAFCFIMSIFVLGKETYIPTRKYLWDLIFEMWIPILLGNFVLKWHPCLPYFQTIVLEQYHENIYDIQQRNDSYTMLFSGIKQWMLFVWQATPVSFKREQTAVLFL